MIDLDAEIAQLDSVLKPLVARTAPDLVAVPGIVTDTAGALLVAADDNPERLRNERSFAHLCGVSSLDTSSGKQLRHRLNRKASRGRACSAVESTRSSSLQPRSIRSSRARTSIPHAAE